MNLSIRELRKQQYDYHNRLYPFMDNWKKSPYTWFKSRFYMEMSAILVFLLLKTKIKPNVVTATYVLLGLIAGTLLAIPAKQTMLLAISIFFLKGILDWTDGHLARVRNQTSVTGGILDPYASIVGTLSFHIGLGFYVASKSGLIVFYYLTALVPLFYALELPQYAFYQLYIVHLTSKNVKKYKSMEKSDYIKVGAGGSQVQGLKNKYKLISRLFNNFLDDRAKTVDFVCLLILFEVFTSIFVTWFIFLGFLIKRFVVFSVSFYLIAKGGWAEEKLKNKIEEIANIS